jgi:nucleoside-diphosphate-sugar epimerase
MRLFLLGANGHTGTQIVDLALARSHAVIGFVRSPEKIGPYNVEQLTKPMEDTMLCCPLLAFGRQRRFGRIRLFRTVRAAPLPQ